MQALWMLLAAFLFSIMGVCVKLASDYYSTAEIVAYRGGMGVLMIGALVWWQRGTLKTNILGAHIWRGFYGVVALSMWFYAMSQLPLSLAVTLSYMSSLWVAVILFAQNWWAHRGEHSVHMHPLLITSLILGFVGVVLLLRPTIHAEQFADSMLALFSGMLAAMAYIQVREMGVRGEPEYRIVFYFSSICVVAGIIATILQPIVFSSQQLSAHTNGDIFVFKNLLLLLIVGLTATSAQLAMTRAYRLGNPLVVASLQYVGIVFASGWDFMIWKVSLGWLSWVGVVVILSSGLLASYQARQATISS
jgi:S-adenosylmethionine uptake transporter